MTPKKPKKPTGFWVCTSCNNTIMVFNQEEVETLYKTPVWTHDDTAPMTARAHQVIPELEYR
jgi:hypothetical protein